jgi:hypothetical protein
MAAVLPDLRWLDARDRLYRAPEHIGVQGDPPSVAPARVPTLCDSSDAPSSEDVRVQTDWDGALPPAPQFEADQRISRWSMPAQKSDRDFADAVVRAIPLLLRA